jgi:hypothetical protein
MTAELLDDLPQTFRVFFDDLARLAYSAPRGKIPPAPVAVLNFVNV